ncbi:unnamed protein product [Effrenium voratum]|nr:unnamed protein product [Effrenium voratum]
MSKLVVETCCKARQDLLPYCNPCLAADVSGNHLRASHGLMYSFRCCIGLESDRRRRKDKQRRQILPSQPAEQVEAVQFRHGSGVASMVASCPCALPSCHCEVAAVAKAIEKSKLEAMLAERKGHIESLERQYTMKAFVRAGLDGLASRLVAQFAASQKESRDEELLCTPRPAFKKTGAQACLEKLG